MQTTTPTIIKRASHNLSRNMISPNALRVMYRLKDNGFSARLVGGAVRDLLIGRTPKDFDIVTDATPEQLKKIFRNCRLIGRRFRLAHIHFRDEIIEVATFRAAATPGEPDADLHFEEEVAEEEGQNDGSHMVNEDGMLLRDNVFGTPHEDAWRRDFTVNALAYDIACFSVIDYVGGIDDLDQRLIRTIGDPWSRFTEDPVRMLRAVRLSAQLGFVIEEQCQRAMGEMAEKIVQASPARLFDELIKLLLTGSAVNCFRLLEESGLLAALLPGFQGWLAATEDNGIIRRLTWLDERVASGAATSPQLFLAILFGGYLQSGVLDNAAPHASYQQRTDSALATFTQEVSSTIQIPQRTLMRLREILLLSGRFVQVPGRKPNNVVTRPAFAEALAYLHLCGTLDRELARSAAWWERFAAKQPAAEDASPVVDGEPQARRRSRRRRRRR